MKHIVESVEELYNRKEPTGEAIVDAVVEILRKFRLIYPEDVALLLDVKVRDLRGAWLILTGMKLIAPRGGSALRMEVGACDVARLRALLRHFCIQMAQEYL